MLEFFGVDLFAERRESNGVRLATPTAPDLAPLSWLSSGWPGRAAPPEKHECQRMERFQGLEENGCIDSHQVSQT